MRLQESDKDKKFCKLCGEFLPIEKFPTHKAGKRGTQRRFLCEEHWKEYCKTRREKEKKSGKRRKYDKERYWNNPEYFREKAKREAREYRKLCIEHYGGNPPVCECCGEQQYEFLCIDHINGGGTNHRKQLKKEGITLYRWLIKQGFPIGYRILCSNCNSSYGAYGYCPHQRNK